MTVKIGDATHNTRRPADLDAQLQETAGVSASEMRRLVGAGAQPAEIARALRPFLGDGAPSHHELAAAIRDAGAAEVARQVAALYDEAPAAEPAAEPEGGKRGAAKS